MTYNNFKDLRQKQNTHTHYSAICRANHVEKGLILYLGKGSSIIFSKENVGVFQRNEKYVHIAKTGCWCNYFKLDYYVLLNESQCSHRE